MLVRSNLGEIIVVVMSFDKNLKRLEPHRYQFNFLSLSTTRIVPVYNAELFTNNICVAEKECAILFRRELLRASCFH